MYTHPLLLEKRLASPQCEQRRPSVQLRGGSEHVAGILKFWSHNHAPQSRPPPIINGNDHTLNRSGNNTNNNYSSIETTPAPSTTTEGTLATAAKPRKRRRMQPTDLCEFYESRGGRGEPVVRLAPVIPKVLRSSRNHICGACLSTFVRQRWVVRLVESYVRLRDSIRCARQLNGLTNPRETAGREAQPYDLGLVCSRKEDEDVQ